ncbi:uncharacterized protein LOC119633552 [Glossina fuscipes]|uniref:Uncharacterized protein LOC119633552 n=1 Tax=Glossina fuscipes TaxID=7396 RepID=A0A8U0WD59_9MUSC|nr:uncharacterized protein LOC119633552 [Glossina fuscipes]
MGTKNSKARTSPLGTAETNAQQSTSKLNAFPEQDAATESGLSVFRLRLLSFVNNHNDPRSPNAQFNRTPLVFEDSPEKSFNMNDTFANLFAESKVNAEQQKQSKLMSETKGDENLITAGEESILNENSIKGSLADGDLKSSDDMEQKMLDEKIDPRSPSFGVDRTPIIFNDDQVEIIEDDLMENFLEALSINLNKTENEGNISSLQDNKETNKNNVKVRLNSPANKLPQIVNGNAQSHHRILKQKRQRLIRQIYEDNENLLSPRTSKLRMSESKKFEAANKRTPLICVRNRPIFRPRSAEALQAVKANLHESLPTIETTNHVPVNDMKISLNK